MPVKVAIVDDHPLLVKGIKNILECTPSIAITGTYLNGKDLLKGLELEQPDVLLLDIQMPGQRGDELVPVLHPLYPHMDIVAFTNLENLYLIKYMVRYGVWGYVLKSSDEAILLAAIESAHNQTRYLDPAIREQAMKVLAADYDGPKNHVLTQREKEILKLIAADYSSQDIAAKLFISKRTVDTHRINLLLKLDVKNMAGLVRRAIELGIVS